jgi:hypothetical protein
MTYLRLIAILAALGGTFVSAQEVAKPSTVDCGSEAKRALGPRAQVLRLGDLTGEGSIECLAVVSYQTRDEHKVLIKSGAILQLHGNRWDRVLSIEGQVRNPQGYVGLDFIDASYTHGFALSTDDERSDGTKGFTLYLTYLDPQLKPEGVAIQVSWNPKVHRFQEYAPNELNPPDFKPEVKNPPVRR